MMISLIAKLGLATLHLPVELQFLAFSLVGMRKLQRFEPKKKSSRLGHPVFWYDFVPLGESFTRDRILVRLRQRVYDVNFTYRSLLLCRRLLRIAGCRR